MLYADLEGEQWVVRIPAASTYTVHQVQRLLGLSSSGTVYAMIERGELDGPCTLEGGQLISHEALVALVESRGPVQKFEQARKRLIEMIQEAIDADQEI